MDKELYTQSFTGQVGITRDCLVQIEPVTNLRPEEGGILFRRDGFSTFCGFIHDQRARKSATEYWPNPDFIEPVSIDLEDKGFKVNGVVHSHPASFFHYSEGDRQAGASWLRLNEAMDEFYIGVMVRNGASGGIGLPVGKMNLRIWKAHRKEPARFEEIEPVVVDNEEAFPIKDEHQAPAEKQQFLKGTDLKEISKAAKAKIHVFEANVAGKSIQGLSVKGKDREVIILLPSEFPIFGPVVLLDFGALTEQMPFCWSFESTASISERLSRLIKMALRY
ncbi:MAG: hypothetical protein JRJ29_01535 [Deltaproteobacteria bacterium]|nr:hypothetical protein [Deltaproteobacteria bacterium]